MRANDLVASARSRSIAEEHPDPEHAFDVDGRDFDEHPIAHFIGDGKDAHSSGKQVASRGYHLGIGQNVR